MGSYARWRGPLGIMIALVAILFFSAGCTLFGTDAPEVIVVQGAVSSNWDPPVDWTSQHQWILTNVYERLIEKDDDLQFTPTLATAWEQTDEHTMRFNLREGVTFHSGHAFTAEDVKHTYERILAGSAADFLVYPNFTWIEEVRVIDTYTVDIIAENPTNMFLHNLSGHGAQIISRGYLNENGPDAMKDAASGTGRFKVKDWGRDDFVLLEANTDYWGDKAEIDGIRFRNVPEASTRVAELLTGDAHVGQALPRRDKDRLEAAEGLRVADVPSDRGFIMSVRHFARPGADNPAIDRDFVTADPRVREAIELAFDKQQLANVLGAGTPIRSRSFMPAAEADPTLYGDAANLYDPDRARALLAEAGFDANNTPRLVFHSFQGRFANDQDFALAMTAMLEAVGFEIDAHYMEWSTFREQIYGPNNNEELMLLSLGANFNPFFALYFNKSDVLGEISYGWVNPQYDALVDQAFSTPDRNEYLRLFHEALHIIAEERPFIHLVQQYELWAMDKNLHFNPRVDNEIHGFRMKWLD